MTLELILYSRRDCCLCDEMKSVIQQVAVTTEINLVEIDVDSSVELKSNFGDEVPVLFIDGRKAFKYRVAAAELKKRLARKRRPLFTRLADAVTKKSR